MGTVNLPAFKQKVVCGSDQMISWTTSASASASSATAIDIELRDATTNEPLRTIVTNTPNLGYYFWNVDQHLWPSDNVMLFIGSILAPRSAPQIYSERFSIVRASAATSAKKAKNEAGAGLKKEWSVSATTTTMDVLESSFSQLSLSGPEKPMRKKQRRGGSSSNGGGIRRAVVVVADDEPIMWSNHPDFVYWAVQISAAETRKNMKRILNETELGPHSIFESTGESVGMFCVRYLLLLYYKDRIDADTKESIENNTYIPHPKLLRYWQRTQMFKKNYTPRLQIKDLVKKEVAAKEKEANAEAERGVGSGKKNVLQRRVVRRKR